MLKERKIEAIARICHEANRAYCAGLGDDSQLSWDDAPQWQRDSAINGVAFHIENPGAGPADSHNSWLSEKLRDGWKFGPVKDPAAKTHPCMLPYEDLPHEQHTKDYLFIAVVRAVNR